MGKCDKISTNITVECRNEKIDEYERLQFPAFEKGQLVVINGQLFEYIGEMYCERKRKQIKYK